MNRPHRCKWCNSPDTEMIERQGYFNEFAVCYDCGRVTVDPDFVEEKEYNEWKQKKEEDTKL